MLWKTVGKAVMGNLGMDTVRADNKDEILSCIIVYRTDIDLLTLNQFLRFRKKMGSKSQMQISVPTENLQPDCFQFIHIGTNVSCFSVSNAVTEIYVKNAYLKRSRKCYQRFITKHFSYLKV
jgi:hypothetical protein